MNEILYKVLVFMAGLIMGVFFFGGLWLTVKNTLMSKTPELWILGSFVFRMGITIFGFYYVASDNWQRLLICMLGFVVARFAIIRITKTSEEKQVLLKMEANHEA